MITDFNQLDLNKSYTYADYLNWQFEEMVEIIKGKVIKMSPAPNRYHQESSSNLLRIIFNHLPLKKCNVFHAPFDVRLPLPQYKQTNNKINTVVQPDICVVCDPKKLDAKGCNGAPDWIIEIISKGTSKKDLTDKFDIYQHAGVKEYWIVFPNDQTCIPYTLNENGIYQSIRPTPFHREEKIPVGIFSNFDIDLKEVFTW